MATDANFRYDRNNLNKLFIFNCHFTFNYCNLSELHFTLSFCLFYA